MSPSTYAWRPTRRAGPTPHQRAEARLVAAIRRIHKASDGTYGAPRVTRELRDEGHHVNHKRVERLMRREHIVGHRPRKRRSPTTPDAQAAPAPDLLGRLFDPDRPDVAWCGDITYIPTDEGWLYLASRHLIGWSMSDRHDASLVCDALVAAVATRGRRSMAGVLVHTDRGAEGGFNWSSQHLELEVVRHVQARACGRGSADAGKMWSPGRPSTARREDRVRFWGAIARGVSTEDAAAEAGVSSAVGTRWFRDAGGMPSLTLSPVSGRYLSFAEREEIAILHAQKLGVRKIACRVGRSPSTISRELRRNASTRGNELTYRATTAQWHAERRASRPKVAKLAANERLRGYVQDRLSGRIARPDGMPVAGRR